MTNVTHLLQNTQIEYYKRTQNYLENSQLHSQEELQLTQLTVHSSRLCSMHLQIYNSHV